MTAKRTTQTPPPAEPAERSRCRRCAFEPPCRTRHEMRQRHGTPDEFNQVVWRVHTQGFCTHAEYLIALGEYSIDYARMPETVH